MSARAALFTSFAIWLACVAVMCVQSRGLITGFTFRDADDALRLVEVRDWLGGQGWFDVTQYRIHPPAGVPMHWSRLVDIPLAGGILLARLFVNNAAAERITLVAVPLLTFLALFATVHVMTLRLTRQRGMAVMACALLALSIGVGLQFQPMRIDHHGWQILLDSLAVLFALRALSGGARQAAFAGLFMATSLTIAIEGLPLAVAIAAALAFLFLRGRAGRTDFSLLTFYLASLTLSCVALMLLTHGVSASLIGWCDALSPAYIAPMAAATAAFILGEQILGRRGVRHRFFCLALAATAGGLCFAGSAPQCFGGPFAQLDPIVYRYWYLNVGEGRPAWTQAIDVAIFVPLQGVIGLIGTLMALRLAPAEQRDGWLLLLFLQIVTFAVALVVIRAMGIAHVLALPGIAWLFVSAFRRAMHVPVRPLRIGLAFSCVLLTPLGAQAVAYTLVVPSKDGESKSGRWSARATCTTYEALRGFDALPRSTIFAPFDIGPDLLVYTHHSMVGTSHHRNSAGMKAVLTGFMTGPDKAEAIVKGTGARYVAYCPEQSEIQNFRRVNPNGLMARLLAGRPPAWLQPVAMPAGATIKVYRIV